MSNIERCTGATRRVYKTKDMQVWECLSCGRVMYISSLMTTTRDIVHCLWHLKLERESVPSEFYAAFKDDPEW